MPSYSGIFTLPAQMQAKAAGNWPDPNVPSVIGQAFGGGFYAGQIGVSGVATHYIIVGPQSVAQSSLLWKNAATTTPGSDSEINGPQNTADMVADGNSTVYPAAHFCNDLVVGSYSDWYLPAKNELEICYFNLKPGTQANNTSSGINPNAVPARASNYTTSPSVPSQTSAADFKTGGAQPFGTFFYWTSTEFSASAANGQNFAYGSFLTGGKIYPASFRAVRRVPV